MSNLLRRLNCYILSVINSLQRTLSILSNLRQIILSQLLCPGIADANRVGEWTRKRNSFKLTVNGEVERTIFILNTLVLEDLLLVLTNLIGSLTPVTIDIVCKGHDCVSSIFGFLHGFGHEPLLYLGLLLACNHLDCHCGRRDDGSLLLSCLWLESLLHLRKIEAFRLWAHRFLAAYRLTLDH